jgi:hypothetical protein
MSEAVVESMALYTSVLPHGTNCCVTNLITCGFRF